MTFPLQSRGLFPASVRMLLGSLFLVVLTATGTFADTRNISGLRFPVDEFTPIDRRAIRITVDGETKIVARDKADDFVLSRVFEREGWHEAFSAPAVMGFIKESLSLDKPDRAVQGMLALMERADVTGSQMKSFSEELLQLPSGEDVLQRSLSVKEPRATEASIVAAVELAGRNPQWTRSNLLSFAYSNREALLRQTEAKFRDSIAKQDFEAAREAVQSATSFFGPEDPQVRGLRTVLRELELARKALSRGEVESLYPLIAMSDRDELLRNILAPILISSFHGEAQSALARENASRALDILAHIPEIFRSDTTRDLVLEAIRKLPPQSKSIAADNRVVKLLDEMSRSDAEVRQAYEQFLVREIAFLLSVREANQVDPYLERLQLYRPDPNSHNDRIRLEQALVLKRLGDADGARERLARMSEQPGFRDLLYLLSQGYYIDLRVLLIMGLFPAVFLLLYKILNELVTDREPVIKSDDLELEEDTPVKPGFSYLALRRGLSPRMHEYANLLRKLNLAPEADLKEIKAAYRSAVKEVHPDLHEASDPDSEEKFRKVNAVYERILELRKELGFPEF